MERIDNRCGEKHVRKVGRNNLKRIAAGLAVFICGGLFMSCGNAEAEVPASSAAAEVTVSPTEEAAVTPVEEETIVYPAAEVAGLTVNYMEEPLGIAVDEPLVLGWKLVSDVTGERQTAYEVRIERETAEGGREAFYDSGQIASSDSVGVSLDVPGLEPETVYFCSVTVQAEKGGESVPAETCFVTEGDLSGVSFVTTDLATNGAMPLFRAEKDLEDKEVVRALLYTSALGTMNVYVNGKEACRTAGETEILAPGWTDYKYNLDCRTYDVTDLIDGKTLTVGAEIGNGWYAGNIGKMSGYGSVFGPDDEKTEPGFLAKLIVRYADGTEDVLATGQERWIWSSASPVLSNDFFEGEAYDGPAAGKILGWTEADYLAGEENEHISDWRYAVTGEYKGEITFSNRSAVRDAKEYERAPGEMYIYRESENLSPEAAGNAMGAVTKHEVTFSEEGIALSAGDKLVIDFGQNAAGALSLTVSGAEGTVVRSFVAEMLNDGRSSEKADGGSDGPEGTLHRSNYREAYAVNTWKLAGGEKETWAPKNTFQGFRYVEISANNNIIVRDAKGLVYTSVGRRTGTIETDDAEVNRLYQNIMWGQISNTLSIPTDCDQRNERLGWGGDTQLFLTTALYNFDVFSFYESYAALCDTHAKNNNNSYNPIMPEAMGNDAEDLGSGWNDAGILIPYYMYRMNGDAGLFAKYLPTMDAYMDQADARGYMTLLYGDWLAPSGASVSYMNAVWKLYLAKIMAEMAEKTGYTEMAAKYAGLYEERFAAFREKYIDEQGNILSSSADMEYSNYFGDPYTDNAQTAILWALKLDLPRNEEERQVMLGNLLTGIANENRTLRPNADENTMSIGFPGLPVILPILTEEGCADTAYSLLYQNGMPSWMYAVEQGATTLWEKWDSYTAEEGFDSSLLNSFNHVVNGALGEWMYSHMSGIAPGENGGGFAEFILQPVPDPTGRMKSLTASYESLWGTISVSWTAEAGKMTGFTCTVPANTTARLYLPMETDAVPEGAEYIGTEIHNGSECAVYALSSGGYSFS